MNINRKLTTQNRTVLKRTKDDIKYIGVHYVGALGDAKANATYYASTYVGASADFYVGFTGDIWQGNDYYTGYSWHCGGGYQSTWNTDGAGKFYGACTNRNSIGIEMCVRKRSTKTMNATDTDWYFEKATVKATIELVAKLMKELDIDEDHVVRHFEVNKKLCPNPFVVDGGKAWKQFKADLHKYLTGETIETTTPFPYYYRVRTTWKNSDSQLGAYTSKENAIENCPIGYSVFDETGTAVYINRDVKTGTQSSDFTASMSEKECAAKILEMARAEGLRCGILPSLIACQAILESGYCRTTELVKKSNNCFGMKTTLSNNDWYSVWDGKSKVNIKTPEEYQKGVITYIFADFRAYPCIEKSFEDHSCYLLGAKNGNKLRYANLTTAKNLKEAATIVKNGGYATDSQYVAKLVSICERYGLDRYDSEVASKIVVSKPIVVEEVQIYRVGTNWKNGNCVGQIGAYSIKENAVNACKNGYKVFDGKGNVVYPVKSEKSTEAKADKLYRVRKTWNDEKSQIGAYSVFENAVSYCKEGYSVYDWNGNEVYSSFNVVETVHPFIELAREFNATMKEDIAKGIKWIYSNSGCKATWDNVRKAVGAKQYDACRTNCAKFIVWILRECGVLKSGQSFYCEHGKLMWSGEDTEKTLKESCDIIDVNGKTVQQLINNGTLQHGDICCYLDMQHVNMMGMNSKWWDAGHAYAKGAGEGAVFSTWLGSLVYGSQRVKYIIRLKDQKMYRTVIGEFSDKSSAKQLADKAVSNGLTKTQYKKIGAKYYTFTGEFKSLNNAIKRAVKSKDLGYKVYILH